MATPTTNHADDDHVPATHPLRRMVALVVLAVLPIAITAIAQPFLPDTVPLHYGASGSPDRWGPKSELFVVASILSALSLFIVGIFAIVEHQKKTGREDWLVTNGDIKFSHIVSTLAIMTLVQAVYVFLNFDVAGFTVPADISQLVVNLAFGILVIPLAGLSLYMLITGKGLSLVNSHPDASELERRMGDDRKQARAIGGLLAFITAFVAIEWILLR